MKISHASTVLAPAEFIYDWHTREGAFERLTPPWENVEMLGFDGAFEHRSVHLKVKRFGVPLYWTSHHKEVIPGRQFVDEQVKGPFKYWRHAHVFQPLADDRTKLMDDIEFKLPLSLISHLVGGKPIKKDIARLLMYRQAIIKHDLQLQYALPLEPQVIAITGASGLIGSHLVPFLTAAGHTVKRLVRKKRPDWTYELCWDPEVGILDDFSDVTMIIHLAGESIASPLRWNDQKKNRISRSRIRSTQALVQQLRDIPNKVSTFVCASAIGIYPSSQQLMMEDSPHGDRFLSRVVSEWEAECDPIRDKIRVCNARFGTVLHPDGGIIKRLKPLMSLGVLGRIADGDQYMSWVSLDDALRAIYVMLANQTVSGPVNVVSPHAQHQHDWIKEWAKSAFRPSVAPLPKTVVEDVMGEMGEELLLQSQRVSPKKLKDLNFQFQCNSMTDVCKLYGL
ncbi:TIGR01777 family protein [Candidatus Marinamargulisbacteria bacterium SCGC AG-343-K17]|nr:TIGR01777 family protein [Candidatus Marinamargulisbacteria bacterium SCGC AG-343-K17]